MFEHKYIVFLENVLEQKVGSFHLDPALKASGLSKDEFKQIQDAYFIVTTFPNALIQQASHLSGDLNPKRYFGT
ncbi:MAG: hypothetical protein JAY74_05615 [Candidatus Thiodiazotropha taylori]|nr:hypothetical protein [Candidatus Thiodiazotropha taylori]